MSYEQFAQRMNGIAGNSKGISVEVSQEGEEYFARFSDGSTIIGSAVSLTLKYTYRNNIGSDVEQKEIKEGN